MEEDDKGCPMIRMGVSGWMFLLVLAYPGSPGQKAIKWLCVCVCLVCYVLHAAITAISIIPVHKIQLLTEYTKSTKSFTSWLLKAIITRAEDGWWNSVGMFWVIQSNRWCTCCKIHINKCNIIHFYSASLFTANINMDSHTISNATPTKPILNPDSADTCQLSPKLSFCPYVFILL